MSCAIKDNETAGRSQTEIGRTRPDEPQEINEWKDAEVGSGGQEVLEEDQRGD